MNLLIGLGNPGAQYQRTRHNIGFRVVEELARRWQIGLRAPQGVVRWGKGQFAGQEVVLAQPCTYMNLSGKAVQKLLSYFEATPEELLIIHDDMDVPVGRLKFVVKGGPGGHRGVSSIIAYLGTDAFMRLKVGIGHPRWGEQVESYVLSPCYADEVEAYGEMITRAGDAVEAFLSEGLSRAMSLFHGAPQPSECPGLHSLENRK